MENLIFHFKNDTKRQWFWASIPVFSATDTKSEGRTRNVGLSVLLIFNSL